MGKGWDMNKEAVTIDNKGEHKNEKVARKVSYGSREAFCCCFGLFFKTEDIRTSFFFVFFFDSSDPVKGEKSVMQEKRGTDFKFLTGK